MAGGGGGAGAGAGAGPMAPGTPGGRASAMLRELEDLRRSLETPGPAAGEAAAGAGSPGPGGAGGRGSPAAAAAGRLAHSAASATPPRGGGGASLPGTPGVLERTLAGTGASETLAPLTRAETHVDRLSHVMEEAEEELEAALRRAGDLHRDASSRREGEVEGLRRVIKAKDRAMDSMRETLAETRRALEARAERAEAVSRGHQLEMQSLRGQLKRGEERRERLTRTSEHLEEAGALWTQERDALEEQVARLQAANQALERDRAARERSKAGEAESVRVRVESLEARLLVVTQERDSLARDLEEEARANQMRRAGERDERKGREDREREKEARRQDSEAMARARSEEALREERAHRERMETLFVSIREALLGREAAVPSTLAQEIRDIHGAIQELQQRAPGALAAAEPAVPAAEASAAAPPKTLGDRRGELRKLLEKDLQAARQGVRRAMDEVRVSRREQVMAQIGKDLPAGGSVCGLGWWQDFGTTKPPGVVLS